MLGAVAAAAVDTVDTVVDFAARVEVDAVIAGRVVVTEKASVQVRLLRDNDDRPKSVPNPRDRQSLGQMRRLQT